ncbi:MAG: prepilin-type N-terminal cleavage/methylation domain-containing protein [Clostridiales Family XIII bacterium]|jgi:prepilin-type N-terminal cleavage/methylation domain-containing protein|nr:prepilin-type N-terminal cleavage/methylation domain-containing protein [Clostridiales Family XIII bacterium]
MEMSTKKWGGAENSQRIANKGFTLVEVIVVLVILAILAAIAVPALTGYINKARYAKIKANAREVTVALQTLLSEAYADPKTSLDNEQLYVDGLYLMDVEPEISNGVNSLYPDDGDGNWGSGSYDIAYTRITYQMHKLTKIPWQSKDPRADGNFSYTLEPIYIDDSFNIIGYSYTDPESIKAKDATTAEYYIYSYNITYTVGGSPWPGSGLYEPDTGYRLWRAETTQGAGGRIIEELPL